MLAAQVPKTGRWLQLYLGGLVHPTAGWVPVPLKLMKSACLEDFQPLTQRPEQLCHGREKSEIHIYDNYVYIFIYVYIHTNIFIFSINSR